MTSARTNYAMVRTLILKDWYLNRWMILGSIPAGLASLAIVLTGKQIAFLLSIILLCMVIIGVGAQLATVTTINERKEQTLAFIISLPVSWREYTAAKILANLIIFLVPWFIVSVGALLVLLLPGATHGLIPFTAIMAVEMLVTTCLIIAAGVITESQAWVTVAILCSSLGINILGYVFAHLRGESAYIAHGAPASGDDLLHPIQEDRFSVMTKAHRAALTECCSANAEGRRCCAAPCRARCANSSSGDRAPCNPNRSRELSAYPTHPQYET